MHYAKYGIKSANPILESDFRSNPTLLGNGHTHQRRWDLAYSTGFTKFSTLGIVTDINIGGNRNASRFVNYHSKYDSDGLFADFNTSMKMILSLRKWEQKSVQISAQVYQMHFLLLLLQCAVFFTLLYSFIKDK